MGQSINTKAWDIICRLMSDTYWGCSSNIESLLRDLDNEVKEFSQSSLQRDITESIDEASDVLMLLLCTIHKIKSISEPDNNDNIIESILNNMIKKLHRRYAPVLSPKNGLQHIDHEEMIPMLQEEEDLWLHAKEQENKDFFLFCTNELCDQYCVTGKGNIKHCENYLKSKPEYFCTACGDKNILTLFPRHRKKRKSLISIIKDYIVKFSAGDIKAAQRMIIDNKQEYDALSHCIYPHNQKHSEYSRKALQMIFKRCGIEVKTTELFFNTIINEQLLIMEFDIQSSIEILQPFTARSWNNQKVQKHILHYNSQKKIECMGIFHYKDTELIDYTVELSNMVGCPIGCKFCASGALPYSNEKLSKLDYIKQMNTVISYSGVNISSIDNFYVSFAGIGEPSLAYTQVSNAMHSIQAIYPNVMFNIATFGVDDKAFSYWASQGHSINNIQIPLYSLHKTKRDTIVPKLAQICPGYCTIKVLDKVIEMKSINKESPRKIKVNFIVMKDINDDQESIKAIIDSLSPYKRDISLKISYLNPTEISQENDICPASEDSIVKINDIFYENGFASYIFGRFNVDNGMGCGQLVQKFRS